jgi:hypothetical protein
MSLVPRVMEEGVVVPGEREPLLYSQSGLQGWTQGRWRLGVVPVEKTPMNRTQSPGLGNEESTDGREGQAQVKEAQGQIPRL